MDVLPLRVARGQFRRGYLLLAKYDAWRVNNVTIAIINKARYTAFQVAGVWARAAMNKDNYPWLTKLLRRSSDANYTHKRFGVISNWNQPDHNVTLKYITF